MLYSFTRATVALRHSTGERGAQVTMGTIEYVLKCRNAECYGVDFSILRSPSFDAKTNSFHLL